MIGTCERKNYLIALLTSLKHLQYCLKSAVSNSLLDQQGQKTFSFLLIVFFLLAVVGGRKKQKQKQNYIYGVPWERYEKPTGCISLSIWQSSCREYLSSI
eukprot:TRINITY_DN3121_c0_g1_i14.p1 TRINITY_DN3121_c0_g1~~TRINITY_DN3121_c0_g1_i14.p1  ORF type:complete len:100 (-),score=11.89 TRINITY_DN3121_c0_g1_i14:197-496(-)